MIVKLTPNLDQIIYRTFLRGRGADDGRAGCVAPDDSMIMAGSSNGEDWPVKNAFQDVLKGPGDAIVAKLASISAIQQLDQ